MLDNLNFLPGKKSVLWGLYLVATGFLKMFFVEFMPPMIDFLGLDPATYISMGISVIFLRFGMKNG